MDIEVVTPDALPEGLVAVGVPVWSSDDGPQIATDPTVVFAVGAPVALDAAWCKRHGFTGKVGQTVTVRSGMPAAAEGESGGPEDPAPDIVMVGAGEVGSLSGTLGLESLRRASAAFVRTVGRGSVAALLLPEVPGLSAAGRGVGRGRRSRVGCVPL